MNSTEGVDTLLDQTKPDGVAPGFDNHSGPDIRVTRRDRDEHGIAPSPDHDDQEQGSLLSDMTALYEDGKTYVTSELAFQKTRAQYAGKQSGKVAALGGAALLIANLALIALTVGAVLSLETLVGPLAATLIVTVVLLIAAGVLAYMAKNKVAEISRVMSGGKP